MSSVLVFSGLPLLIWAMGHPAGRSVLKESLSVVTILGFCQMIGQFFWARTNRCATETLRMGNIIKYHKVIGYTFTILLLCHPVFPVIPRFFESGVAPGEAFATIITTFSRGVVLGIIAWCLMLVIGITSLFRKRLPMKYTTWRAFHGILAILFTGIAAWHAIDLGRHSGPAMSAFISVLTAGGILLLVETWILNRRSEASEKTGEICEA